MPLLCRDCLRRTVDADFAVYGLFSQALLQNFPRRASALAALGTGSCFSGQAAQGSRTAFHDGVADLTVRYGFTNTNVHNILSFFRIEAMRK